MKKLDKDFPEDQIQSLMKALDLDEDGSVNFEEFQRVFSNATQSSSRKQT